MAEQICTKCGYEGRGKKSPNRSGGGLARLLGMLMMLPIYTLWKASASRKICPHCDLPTMVKMNSEAGRLKRHMVDVELGLIQVKKPEEKKTEGFGNERPDAPKVEKKPVDPEVW